MFPSLKIFNIKSHFTKATSPFFNNIFSKHIAIHHPSCYEQFKKNNYLPNEIEINEWREEGKEGGGRGGKKWIASPFSPPRGSRDAVYREEGPGKKRVEWKKGGRIGRSATTSSGKRPTRRPCRRRWIRFRSNDIRFANWRPDYTVDGSAAGVCPMPENGRWFLPSGYRRFNTRGRTMERNSLWRDRGLIYVRGSEGQGPCPPTMVRMTSGSWRRRRRKSCLRIFRLHEEFPERTQSPLPDFPWVNLCPPPPSLLV